MNDSGGIGSRVRAARERLGWTREALAFHAGVSWSGIAQVESGRRTNLRPSTLGALSRALGVSIDYLVGSALPPRMLEHSVFQYRADDEFQATIGSFLADGVERSEAVLAVTTAPNIELLREHLGEAIGRPLSVADMAKLCGLEGPDGADTIRKWEVTGPTGPVAELLRILAQHAGKVLTHRFLLGELWDTLTDAQYLRVYVRQVRQKIEADPERPSYILTETGIGYRLRAPE